MTPSERTAAAIDIGRRVQRGEWVGRKAEQAAFRHLIEMVEQLKVVR